MLKMIKLIVIVLSIQREVGVAALFVSAQTPGRGGIFCYKCNSINNQLDATITIY
jgi:hypothetical protein